MREMKRLIKYKTEDFTEGVVFGYNLYVARELEIDTPDFEALYKVLTALGSGYSKLEIQSIENIGEIIELPHYVREKPKDKEIIDKEKEFEWMKSKKGKYLPTRMITRADMLREQITDLYMNGKTNSQIADELDLSESTVQRATYKWGLRDKSGNHKRGRR